jgi:hypothetical protein
MKSGSDDLARDFTMTTRVPPKGMTEDRWVGLVRNALLVSGEEMGADGDHWPAIKSTIHSIMKDSENLKIEKNVDAELKPHLYRQLETMERDVAKSSDQIKSEVMPKLRELRDIYDAYFSNVGMDSFVLREEEIPDHIKRAEVIISTLENTDE